MGGNGGGVGGRVMGVRSKTVHVLQFFFVRCFVTVCYSFPFGALGRLVSGLWHLLGIFTYFFTVYTSCMQGQLWVVSY